MTLSHRSCAYWPFARLLFETSVSPKTAWSPGWASFLLPPRPSPLPPLWDTSLEDTGSAVGAVSAGGLPSTESAGKTRHRAWSLILVFRQVTRGFVPVLGTE